MGVWKKAKSLVIQAYDVTANFPRNEEFGMISQIRRAALSVPANIAEGFGRYSYLDKAKFYINARGSLLELRSHFSIAIELSFLDADDGKKLFAEIDDLCIRINNLISKTRKSARDI